MRLKIRPLASAVFVLLCAFFAAAQDDAPPPTVALLAGRAGIVLDIPKTPPNSFYAYSKLVATYRLYEVETPDPEKMCAYAGCIREWKDFIDTKELGCTSIDCQRLNIRFKSAQPLPPDRNFVLMVDKFKADGKAVKVSFSTATAAKIESAANAFKTREEFRVTSNAPLASGDEIKLKRSVYRVEGDKPEHLKAVEVQEDLTASLDTETPLGGNTLSYKLDKKLREGESYNLSVADGIKDDSGRKVEAKGTLSAPGLPDSPTDPKFAGTFTFESAARQKAVFQLTGNFQPLRNPNVGSWFWEPNLVVDIGLHSTKSNNSVTLAVPATRFIRVHEETSQLCQRRNKPGRLGVAAQAKACEVTTNITNYARWRETPWDRLADVKLYLGPKAEFDRNFKRKNLLGNLRLDFDFHRWLGSVANKRDKIIEDLGDEKGKSLVGINSGFTLVPYLSFDFGGHVNNETVSKGAASVFVPRHSIARGYAGLNGTIEWRVWSLPMDLTLDESVAYLAKSEQIGYTTDDGAFLRQIRGVHPHFKTSFDLAFDPAKHYSFTVVYENGRLAPNFEYLNKVSSGVKITY